MRQLGYISLVTKAKTLAILIIILLPLQLYATTYRIDSYDIEIKGRTREAAVRRHIGYDEGKEFSSVEELENAIERKRQALLDLRIFKDVAASWEPGAEVDGCIPVKIDFLIDGAFSFIVFPSVSYDSNYGFFYQLYVQDQNFLGTTGKTAFSIALRENDNIHDIGYSNLNTYIETDLPLGRFWDLYARLYLRHSGKDAEETTLTLENTLERKLFEAGFFRSTFYMNTNPESQKRSDFRIIMDMSEKLELAFNEKMTFGLAHEMDISEDDLATTDANSYISASLNLNNFTKFNLIPSVRLRVPSHNGEPSSPAVDFMVSSSDYLIDWTKDFRDGYYYSIDAFIGTDGKRLVSGEAAIFNTPVNWMQLSSRLSLRLANFPDLEQTEKFTIFVRGNRNDNVLIKDREINSIGAINLDAQFHLFSIPKFVNVYAGPFVELGYISTGDFIACAGAEMLVILEEWPGAPGRITYARNLLDPNEFEFSAFAYFFY